MTQIPVGHVRPIVNRWLAEFDFNEQGYRYLGAASTRGAA